MLSLLHASAAILSERSLDKLVPTMLRAVADVAGAHTSALVVEQRGTLVVEATLSTPSPDADHTGPLSSDAARAALDPDAETLVRKAIRENKIEQAKTETKAMLAIPLVEQDALFGTLYVEGSTDACDLPTLEMLSGHISIALKNARDFQSQAERVKELSEALTASIVRLNKTREQLMQSEKMASLGRLTVGIAHEIKNPLNFINNFAQLNVELVAEIDDAASANPQLLASDVTDALTEIRSGSDKIAEHGRRADSIVRSMMQHATGASGVKQPVDLNALVEDYVKLSYHSSRADHQPFELRIERDYDASLGKVDVIVQDLARVLVNLFSNALYALGEKKRGSGSGFVATLYVGTKRQNGTVAITIRDNGTGIPEEARAYIFDPFFTTKPGNAGTGLGLSMSHDIIVNGHGGTITLDTILGEHTTFTITLPR